MSTQAEKTAAPDARRAGPAPTRPPPPRRVGAQAADRDQREAAPGPLAALFSHVVWPNWTAALLLVITMWMPHFTGCDGKPIRPAEMWSNVDSGEDLIGSAILSWHYLWAALFAVTLIAIALIRPQRPERVLFHEAAGTYLLISIGFIVGAAVSLFHWLTGRSPLGDTLWIWFCAPAVIAPGLWAASSIRRGNLFSAWARLSTALALFAVATVLLLGIFARESRYGFNLAMLACAVLVPACWVLRCRGRRALADRGAPVEPLRFRLSHLVTWVTLMAVVCGYYRFLAIVS